MTEKGKWKWEPLTRSDVSRVLDEYGEADIDRIRQALAKPIDDLALRERWKDMKKQRTATQARQRRRGGESDMLKELRGLDIERTDLDEMVALSAFGRDMKAEYDRLVIPVPEWLEDRLTELDRETRLRRTDALEKKLKELNAREDALKTADQKRTDVAQEKAKVMAALGKTG